VRKLITRNPVVQYAVSGPGGQPQADPAGNRRPRGVPSALAVGLTFVFALLGPVPVQAGSVLFQPTPASVQAGDLFSLDLVGQGFSEIVDGGGLSFSFDAALLQVTGVTVDTTTWDFLADNGTIDNATGLVSEIQFNAFLTTVTNDFPIATVDFEALAPGVTTLGLSASTLNPFAGNGEAITVSLVDGSVDIAATPAPAVPLLLLTGLASAAHLRRRTAA